jgi:hypothetical protein
MFMAAPAGAAVTVPKPTVIAAAATMPASFVTFTVFPSYVFVVRLRRRFNLRERYLPASVSERKLHRSCPVSN